MTSTEKSQNHGAAGLYREVLRAARRFVERATSPKETKKIPMSIATRFMILAMKRLLFRFSPKRLFTSLLDF